MRENRVRVDTSVAYAGDAGKGNTVQQKTGCVMNRPSLRNVTDAKERRHAILQKSARHPGQQWQIRIAVENQWRPSTIINNRC